MEKKQYAEASAYEAKLEKVMARLGVEKFNYDWSRFSCFVEFTYRGQFYRFEHSREKAEAHGIKVKYGSDLFAQLVLSLEDIARMSERGIYELSTWIEGLRALPAPKDIPDCLKLLGFAEMPESRDDVKQRFRAIAKTAHPDSGGSAEHFNVIKNAYDQAVNLFQDGGEP